MVSGKISNKAAIKKELLLILPKIEDLFESEPTVLRIDIEPIMIVGDIHWDLKALDFILRERETMDCKNIIFLGDYVDRGLQGT